MGVVTTAQQITADEFLALEPHEGWHELIGGEVVVNHPSWMHNRCQRRISFALDVWVRDGSARGEFGLPADVVLDDQNVYGPDLLWYRDGRAPKPSDLSPYPIPDLVVEVRSPSMWRYDVGIKKSLYESRGVAELWLVDTAADAVLVFRRSKPDSPDFDMSEELDTSATLTSPLLPGFGLPVAEIFGD